MLYGAFFDVVELMLLLFLIYRYKSFGHELKDSPVCHVETNNFYNDSILVYMCN